MAHSIYALLNASTNATVWKFKRLLYVCLFISGWKMRFKRWAKLKRWFVSCLRVIHRLNCSPFGHICFNDFVQCDKMSLAAFYSQTKPDNIAERVIFSQIHKKQWKCGGEKWKTRPAIKQHFRWLLMTSLGGWWWWFDQIEM